MRSKIASAYGSGESSGNGKRLMSDPHALRARRHARRRAARRPRRSPSRDRARSRRARERRADTPAASRPGARAAARPPAAARPRTRAPARQRLLGLADEEGVDERRQRLGVRRRRPARTGPADRVARSAARSGKPRQIEHVQHVGVVSSYCSEKCRSRRTPQRTCRLQRHERQPARAQLGLAVEPGREGRSQAMPGCLFRRPYRILVPRWDIPIS
jgi:hypothetical protein